MSERRKKTPPSSCAEKNERGKTREALALSSPLPAQRRTSPRARSWRSSDRADLPSQSKRADASDCHAGPVLSERARRLPAHRGQWESRSQATADSPTDDDKQFAFPDDCLCAACSSDDCRSA